MVKYVSLTGIQYICNAKPERCRSGLTGTPGERVYGKPYRGFESLSFRSYIIYFQNKMYYVYVLYSQKLNKRYIGSTKDINRRIKEHNFGKSNFTAAGIPWNLIYKESFPTNNEARKRELFLKSGIGRKFLDQMLK